MSVNWRMKSEQQVIDLLISVSLFAAVNGAVYWLATSEDSFLVALDDWFVILAFVLLIALSYLVLGAMFFSLRVISIRGHDVVFRRIFGKKQTYSLGDVEKDFSIIQSLYVFRCSGERRLIWNHLGGGTLLAESLGKQEVSSESKSL